MKFWITSKSFFDVWSIAHLSFWIFIGSCLWPFMKEDSWWPKRIIALIICLIFAFGWEIFEKYAEINWPKLWLHRESWINSWISDPLTTIIGVIGMMWALDRWAK